MRKEPSSITARQARIAILQTLGIGDISDQGIVIELCAEALRTALWSVWSATQKPVYTTRLLNIAERILAPWMVSDDAPESGELRNTLDELLQEMELIGDIAALPGGYWTPAPLRVVRFIHIHRWLLLGGYPSRLLSQEANAAIEHTGVARLLKCAPMMVGLEGDELPELEWRSVPEGDLVEWSKTVLEQSPLAPVGELQAEIYAPALAERGAFQYHRWRPLPQGLPNGRYLARTALRYGALTCFIVEIQHGRIVAAGPPRLGDGDVRRLQYGLDLLAGNPVQVIVTKSHNDWHFKVHSALPRAEHRLLLAIGRDISNSERYYPRWWKVPAQYAAQVQQALQGLGILLKDEGKAD